MCTWRAQTRDCSLMRDELVRRAPANTILSPPPSNLAQMSMRHVHAATVVTGTMAACFSAVRVHQDSVRSVVWVCKPRLVSASSLPQQKGAVRGIDAVDTQSLIRANLVSIMQMAALCVLDSCDAVPTLGCRLLQPFMDGSQEIYEDMDVQY
jgi:hypothetical protein